MVVKLRKSVVKQEIGKILRELSKLSNDEYWKNIFEDLGNGKYSNTIFVDGNTIYCSNKCSYGIQIEKPLQETYEELCEFLSKNAKLVSQQENDKKVKLIESKKTRKKSNKWSSIKKKTFREISIINFVLESKKKYALNKEKTRDLLTLINMGFIYKLQDSDNVQFDNGKITSIDGIEYNSQTKTFENVREDSHIKESKRKVYTKISDFWEKYHGIMLKPLV
jgi:hypothetical protein